MFLGFLVDITLIMITKNVYFHEPRFYIIGIYENIWNFYACKSYKHIGGDLDVWFIWKKENCH